MQVMAHRIGVVGSLQNPAAIWLRDRIMPLGWAKAFQAAENEHVKYGTRWSAAGATATATATAVKSS